MRQIARTIARNRMKQAGVRQINKKESGGRSYFAKTWRAWLNAKPRKPSLWRRFRYWWYRFKLIRLMKKNQRKAAQAKLHRERMIRRDQKFKAKYAKERADNVKASD